MKHHRLAALAALLATWPTLAPAAAGVVVNARIHTMDAARPEAEAMAWDDGGRIVAIGSRAQALAAVHGAPVRDLRGATVVPGLIDAHAHLMSLGFALMEADLVGTRSKAEIVE